MAIDLGNIPSGTPPSPAEQLQIRKAIGVGTTDAPTFLAQTLTGQSLTGTQATSLIDLNATWNTDGNPSLIYARVTTTNANNAAKLLDLGTSSQGQVFSVNRYGGVASADSVSVASGSHMSGTTVGVGPAGRFGFSSNTGNSSGFVFSTGLYQDDPGILAQRNGTAKQALRVYNTIAGADSQFGGLTWLDNTNELQLSTGQTGAGAAQPLCLRGQGGLNFRIGGAPGTLTWQMTTAGHWLAATDNTYDIGASGARPKSLYLGSSLLIGSAVVYVAGGAVVARGSSGAGGLEIQGVGATQGARLDFYQRVKITPQEDGVLSLQNNASSDFNRIQLGSTADTHPAIARDGAGVKFTGAATGLTSWIKVPAVAVSALPLAATAGVGARSFVDDALSPVFGSAVTGGGAVTVPVYSTGSAWNVG